MKSGEGVVANEFAEVRVRLADSEVGVGVDTEANSPRLRLEDAKTGRVRYLDALELETLVWLPDGHLCALLDPSASRWRDEPSTRGEPPA